jgi:hypothetical protein
MRSSDPVPPEAKVRIVPRLIVFFAPILIAWLCLELWTAKTVPNFYAIKRRMLDAQAAQVDTLVTGSSRAAYGIAPKQLAGYAFNLAGLSESMDYNYLMMMRVLPKLPKLRRIVIEIQDLSLFYQLRDGQTWRRYYYQQEWGIPPLELRDWLDARMFSRVALYGGVLPEVIRSFVGGTKFVPDPSVFGIDDRGWFGEDRRAPDLSPAGAAITLSRHAALMKATYESLNLNYLKAMLSVFRQRGIEAVLVTLPVSPNYSTGMNKDYWTRTQAAAVRIAAEYGVHYYCFLNVPELGTQEFLDPDHLTRPGAIRFTKLLRRTLEHSPTLDQSSCACCSK